MDLLLCLKKSREKNKGKSEKPKKTLNSITMKKICLVSTSPIGFPPDPRKTETLIKLQISNPKIPPFFSKANPI